MRASYLAGCDGAGSSVRHQLGIELQGDSLLTRSAAAASVCEGHSQILVRPDLHVVWRGHGELASPDALAALATGHGNAAHQARAAE